MKQRVFSCACLVALTIVGSATNAAIYQWADWQTSNNIGGFNAFGTITTTTTTVNVTYSNPNGISFYQTGGGTDTDYWQNGSNGGRNDAISPYTSSTVSNSPTGTDIIALQFAGTQTLTFSQTIANPVFSYVSLNGNGYAFDQDFEILSFGDGSPNNVAGYWGAGTSYKSVVDLGGGNFEYQLLGTGEPHGTIRFTGAFDQVSWRSLSNENWNGFTVGIEGTAGEVFPPGAVPEPATVAIWSLLGVAGAAIGYSKRRSA